MWGRSQKDPPDRAEAVKPEVPKEKIKASNVTYHTTEGKSYPLFTEPGYHYDRSPDADAFLMGTPPITADEAKRLMELFYKGVTKPVTAVPDKPKDAPTPLGENRPGYQRMALMSLPIVVIVKLLEACGGSLVLDGYDMLLSEIADPNQIIIEERKDPYQLIVRLKDD